MGIVEWVEERISMRYRFVSINVGCHCDFCWNIQFGLFAGIVVGWVVIVGDCGSEFW